MSRKTKVTKKELVIAEKNGISRSSVYSRIQRGWGLSEAIRKPTDHKKNSKRKKGLGDIKRGKLWSFKLPAGCDEKLQKTIARSGLTASDFLALLVLEDLQNNKQSPPL